MIMRIQRVSRIIPRKVLPKTACPTESRQPFSLQRQSTRRSVSTLLAQDVRPSGVGVRSSSFQEEISLPLLCTGSCQWGECLAPTGGGLLGTGPRPAAARRNPGAARAPVRGDKNRRRRRLHVLEFEMGETRGEPSTSAGNGISIATCSRGSPPSTGVRGVVEVSEFMVKIDRPRSRPHARRTLQAQQPVTFKGGRLPLGCRGPQGESA